MKSVAFALLVFSSGIAHAACQNGMMTKLKSEIEVSRKEGPNTLKIMLAPGTDVHIVDHNKELTMIYATPEFQGQPLSFTTFIRPDDVAKVLQCSEEGAK